jgi:sucrose phosphorylase
MGLLAGENDMDLLESTKVGRDINRHYYTKKEIRESLQKPVVKKLIELIQLRNNHPAFLGEFSMPDCQKDQLVLQWNKNYEKAVFDLDLKSKKLKISFAGSAGTTILQIGS